jgi:ferredoxin
VPQLYIDPVECIDCGACVPVCPVSAIFALDDLPEKWKQYTELNESYVKAGKFTPEEFAKHQTEKQRWENPGETLSAFSTSGDGVRNKGPLVRRTPLPLAHVTSCGMAWIRIRDRNKHPSETRNSTY